MSGIDKGSRHSRVIGNFGEHLVCNWMRFEAKDRIEEAPRRSGEVLRAIYAQQRDVRGVRRSLRADRAFGQGLSCSCRHIQGAAQA